MSTSHFEKKVRETSQLLVALMRSITKLSLISAGNFVCICLVLAIKEIVKSKTLPFRQFEYCP